METLTEAFWDALDGPVELLAALAPVTGAGSLPSYFRVTDLATASVSAAGLAIGELITEITGSAPMITVDRALASGWFGSSFRPIGWEVPSPWDALAGDYATADGWIRLHTNAPHHRAAALRVLEVPATPGCRRGCRRLLAVPGIGGGHHRGRWMRGGHALRGRVGGASAGRGGRRRAAARVGPKRFRRDRRSLAADRGQAARRAAGARPHPGHRRPGRDPIPRRVRGEGAPHRPAGLGGAGPRIRGQPRQALRPTRREDAGGPGAAHGTHRQGGCPGSWLPARSPPAAGPRFGRASGDQAGADRRVAERLRLERTVGRPARFRLARADEQWNRGARDGLGWPTSGRRRCRCRRWITQPGTCSRPLSSAG